ncbi:MAG: sulfatase-like hydrolase/transferase [Acidobacteriota bacterium]
MRQWRIPLWALPVLLGAGLASGSPQTATVKPSVILITIDTLRADRVGQQPKSITPAIDALALDGVRFTRAMAQVPITLPSHVSILTGAHPMYHGMRDFGGIRLKQERETLAELLKGQGYQTAAFVSSFALDSTWGLDQGFDSYHDNFDLSGYQGIGFNAVERRGDQTMDLVLQWLGRQDGSAPFFLWVHLFDPHDPYQPPSPYKERFAEALYDGEVAFADAQVGRLVDALKERQLYDPSLIVLMGDHGEGLGEHGEETHGFFIYNTTLHIPLLFKLPGNELKAKEFAQTVMSVDVAPTILQMLRRPRGQDMQGQGLYGLMRNGRFPGAEQSYSESYYARYHFGWSSLTAYQDGRYKFIRAPRKEFYDLRQDPGERNNLYPSRTALAEQYNNLLDQLIGKYKNRQAESLDQQHGDMDAQTRQRLQSLGYITAAAERNVDMEDLQRADPKDKIEVFSKVRKATIASEKGRLEESIQLLSEVARLDPKIYSARYLQGFNFFQKKQFMLAVEEFKAALKVFPESTDAVHSLALSYFNLGLDEEARLGYQQLTRQEPERPRGHLGLGRVALKAKQHLEAESHFRKAVQLGGTHRAAVGLGRSLLAQNKLDEALKEFERIVRRVPKSAETHLLLAYTYDRKGLTEKARQHKEIFEKLTGRPMR